MTSVRDLCDQADRYRLSVLTLRASGFREREAVRILANFGEHSGQQPTRTLPQSSDRDNGGAVRSPSGTRAVSATGID